jgi:hypothetical protein
MRDAPCFRLKYPRVDDLLAQLSKNDKKFAGKTSTRAIPIRYPKTAPCRH